MQSLRVLRIHSDRWHEMHEPELMSFIVGLPHLHTLQASPALTGTDAWAMLPDAPSLTSLDLDGRSRDQRACLPWIAQCKLTHLSFCIHAFDSGAGGAPNPMTFPSFFTSPSLRGLHSLLLRSDASFDLSLAEQGLEVAFVSAEDYAAAFAALPALRRLDLVRVQGFERMLPPLVTSHALRTLTIHCHSISEALAEADVASLASSLLGLLTANAQLCCTFSLPIVKSQQRYQLVKLLQKRFEFSPEFQPFGDRFSLQGARKA
jgi:hypothetical protein